MDAQLVSRNAKMSEFFEYLEQLVFEVETGRLEARQMRSRFIQDWGGVMVRGYVPRQDPKERAARRAAVQALVESGISVRAARRKVCGK
jgi:hypothetical protein